METTDFQDILAEAAAEVTALDPDNLSDAEFRYIRRAAKKRLEMCWEYHYWPDLDRMEQRFYRPDWNPATNYTPVAEVYYPPTQRYYQALQPSLNIPPATYSPNVPDSTTNLTYWAQSQRYYGGATFDPAGIYNQGAIVIYADAAYQLFALSATGILPTNTAYWGLLTRFDQYVLYEQPGETPFTVVNGAWNVNPRTSTRGRELNWSLSENGLQISSNIHFAWVDYRIRCPKLNGEPYGASTAYATGAQIYYSTSATLPGNFYNATTTTTAGQTPDTTPGAWSIVSIPRIFHKYLVHSIAGDWIRGPGGGAPEDAQTQLGVAEEALENMKTLLVMQQSQHVKTVVMTR